MCKMLAFYGVCPILYRSELPPHSNCASASIKMQRMKGYHGCNLVRLRPSDELIAEGFVKEKTGLAVAGNCYG